VQELLEREIQERCTAIEVPVHELNADFCLLISAFLAAAIAFFCCLVDLVLV